MRWSPTDESKNQLHQRNAQMRSRNCKEADERKLPDSVAQVQPIETNETAAQSHQRNTYIMPSGGSK
jgi:hypothetical protein